MLKESFNGTLTAVKKRSKTILLSNLSHLEVKGGLHMRLIAGRLKKTFLRVHELPQFVVIILVQGCQIYNNLPTGFKGNKRKPRTYIKDSFFSNWQVFKTLG